MTEENDNAEGQFGAALHAFSVCAMNGIILLASRLRGGGALDDEHVRALHEYLTLPLVQPENAGNPFIAPMQDLIDQRMADLMMVTGPAKK